MMERILHVSSEGTPLSTPGNELPDTNANSSGFGIPMHPGSFAGVASNAPSERWVPRRRCAKTRSVKRRSWISVGLALFAIALVVLVYFWWNASIRRDRAELPRYGFAPEFKLRDQDDIPLDKERLRGKIWVAGFIDVADSDSNALLSSRFAELDQNFRKGERLALVSTVLPAVNQRVPELADFARHYLASSRWHFVSGTSAETHDLLDRWEPIASTQTDRKVASRFFLVDSEGVVRGEYDGRSPETVQRILEDIGTLLRSGTK